MIRFPTLGLLVALGLTASAGGQVRVYIAPDDHTDFFWSATDDVYHQVFQETIDYYLDLADATEANPPQYQSRWNCDGSYWMWVYQQNRTPAEFQRLIDRIKDGHISVPLNGLCVCLGGAPTEAVIRGMYYPGRIERAFDVRFEIASMIENQTQPYGLTSLWAGSGARYSWKGICGCASYVPDAWDRERDIYWAEGPDGARVLMKWNSMLFGNQNMGGYAECRNPAATIDTVTTNAPFNGFRARYPYDVIGCFGKGWDDVQTMTDEFVTVAQAMSDATRQIIVSNEIDFFEDFEQTWGHQIPAHGCSFGNEWDLHCTGLAEVSARIRRAVEKLRAAEAMAAVVSLHDPAFMDGRESARDLAWMDLGIYWEHDFGMDGFGQGHPWVAQRIAWQRQLADDIDAYVDALHTDAAAALGDLVPVSGGHARLVVFNPLGWTRGGPADLPFTGPGPVHVVDVATESEVPAQITAVGGETVLRLLAADVPPVGYRVYEIRPGAGQDFGDAASVMPAGAGTTTVVYEVASDERDAMSNAVVPPPHEVRVSGYSGAQPYDYVGADFEQQSAAMAFAIDVPAGTTITEAYLTVRGVASQNPSPTGAMEVHLYDVADTAPFVDGPHGDLIGHHPTHPSPVLWPAPSWPVGADAISPNVSVLVQAFIDRPDYMPGTHVGFVVTEGTIETNRYYGWEDFAAGGAPPRLTVISMDGPAAADSDDLIADNGVYAVRVTPRGAVTSIIDHARDDRELVLAQGGLAANDLGASTGALTVEDSGPVSVTLRADAPLPLQHRSRITLYRDSDRIDLANEITQNFDGTYSWSYGFNLPSPQTRHEEVGAILRARLLGDGGDYSPRNARYDWLTMNHFADLTAADGVGVTLSNADCYFMQLGNSSTSVLDTATPRIRVMIGSRGLGSPGGGIANQGGGSNFRQRFALRAHDAYDPAAAMRFALEHQNPLVAFDVTGGTGGLPETGFSAITISDPDVLLWALKPAEEGVGEGLIARLWNVADQPRTADVAILATPVAAAAETTHLETDLGCAPVAGNAISATFARQQLRTFRLRLSGSARPGDLDGDCVVGVTDFLALLAAWGPCPAPPESCPGDFDGNGTVDVVDFLFLLEQWG